mgnify:CR=1 FL=1
MGLGPLRTCFAGTLLCLPAASIAPSRSKLSCFCKKRKTSLDSFSSCWSTVSLGVFGSMSSAADLSSHLRLSETATDHAAIAIEYDTCDAVFASARAAVGWVAVSALPGQDMRVTQVQTLSADAEALLGAGLLEPSIGADLRAA